MIKSFWFNKKIYPLFLKEINKVFIESKFLINFENEDDFMKITLIINKQIYIINKYREASLNIKLLNLPDSLKIKNNFDNINEKEFIKMVYKLKNEASIVDSQHIIDFFNTTFRTSIGYYKFKADDIKQIYNILLDKGETLFLNNPPATVIYNEKNKWID